MKILIVDKNYLNRSATCKRLLKKIVICSASETKSSDEKKLLEKIRQIKVFAAGLHPSSQVQCDQETIDWADTIFVMETWMKYELIGRFGENCAQKTYVLHVPSFFRYNDDSLIQILRNTITPFFKSIYGLDLYQFCYKQVDPGVQMANQIINDYRPKDSDYCHKHQEECDRLQKKPMRLPLFFFFIAALVFLGFFLFYK